MESNSNKSIIESIVSNQDKNQMLNRSLQRIIQLYTDKAHFVYELLQNAEDAEASKICFIQHKNNLEVIHNGKAFSGENLNSLCDIGNSNKINKLNKIGEFGVGFKSVFSICKDLKLYSSPLSKDSDLPTIACEIKNFVDPQEIPFEEIPDTYTTRFVFPYHVGSDFSGFSDLQNLRNAISTKLKKLEATTLLFMKHLTQIEYDIEVDGARKKGCYSLTRNSINNHCEEITTNGGDDSVSYLVFSKETNVANRSVNIAIPFKKDSTNKYIFCKTNNPYVSVYFPTEKESKLDFIVQGPFRTTPNRGSIPEDDEENQRLSQILADLLKDSLLELRDKDILTIELLRLMPVYEERFGIGSSLFKPLYTQVMDLLKTETILPCKDGGYTTCKNARISRGKELANHLDNAKLTSLIGKDKDSASWLSTELTETNSAFRDLYRVMKNEIGVIEIRPEDLGKLINDNPDFLPQMENEWIAGLYNNIFDKIAGSFAKNKPDNMLSAKIIKISDGSFECPYIDGSPNVFLYSSDIEPQAEFKIVDKELCSKCNDFLKNTVHLTIPDEYDCFLQGIRKRYANVSENPPLFEQHVEDVKKAIKYKKNRLNVFEDLSSANFCLYTDSDDDELFAPTKYIPLKLIDHKCSNPLMFTCIVYESSEHDDIEGYLKNCNEKYIWIFGKAYKDYGITIDDLVGFKILESLTLYTEVNTGKFYASKNQLVEQQEYIFSTYRPVNCYGRCSYKPWFTLRHIDKVLSYIEANPAAPDSIIKSKVIFEALFRNESLLHGYLSINGKTDDISDHNCTLIRILNGEKRKTKWLYDKKNNLVSPKEISKEELSTCIYGEIKPNTEIYKWLGFKDSSTTIMDSIEKLISQLPNNCPQKEALRLAIQKTSANTIRGFPIKKVNDWDRLKIHAAKELFFADPVKYESKIRSVRISLKPNSYRTYLKHMYEIESTDNIACQLCHEEFLNFEGPQLLERLPKEINPLHLCLCQNCTRVYQIIRSNSKKMEEITDSIKQLNQNDISSAKEHVDIQIDQNKTLWFTQRHIAEIQEILNLIE